MKPIEHIDEYMAGKLSAEERVSFEAAMQQDAELRELVANYDTIKEVSTLALEEELLNEVKTVAKKSALQSTPPTSKLNFRSILGIAASILLLIATFVFFNSYAYKQKKEEIKMANYQQPDPGTVRSGDTSNFNNLEKAKDYFDRNYHKEAKELLEKELANSSGEFEISEIKYWLAHSYYKLSEYDKAIILLNQSSDPIDPCLLQLCKVLFENKTKADLERAEAGLKIICSK